MAKHMCSFNGCHNIIEHGTYCEEHAYSQPFKQAHAKKRSVYHHDNKPVYRSQEWQSVCEVVDLREHNACQNCGRIVFGRNKQHHHIIPIKDDPTLEFEPNNIMLLCAKCHPIVEHEQEIKKQSVFANYFEK